MYKNEELFHTLSVSLILSASDAEETAEERVNIVGVTLQGQQASWACKDGQPGDSQGHKDHFSLVVSLLTYLPTSEDIYIYQGLVCVCVCFRPPEYLGRFMSI